MNIFCFGKNLYSKFYHFINLFAQKRKDKYCLIKHSYITSIVHFCLGLVLNLKLTEITTKYRLRPATKNRFNDINLYISRQQKFETNFLLIYIHLIRMYAMLLLNILILRYLKNIIFCKISDIIYKLLFSLVV